MFSVMARRLMIEDLVRGVRDWIFWPSRRGEMCAKMRKSARFLLPMSDKSHEMA